MKKISVIVPFVREWPQVAFTIRSIHEALVGVEHEVLAIDNLMPHMKEDRGTKNIKGMAEEWSKKGDPWLKYYHYTERLSHWQCKNFGVDKAEGDFIWFIDSHCIVPTSASRMVSIYQKNYEEFKGSLHIPLTYHILEPRQLMYKAVVDVSKADYHYTFHSFNPNRYTGFDVVEIPAMSTCGMMIHRDYLAQLGHWPIELGIYGGGENFINYTMAVLGLKKWLWIGDSLCHHGDKRGYSWNLYDQQRNRSIATYIFGGRRLLTTFINRVAKFGPGERRRAERSILDTTWAHRAKIKESQVYEIEEWLETWKDHELMIGEF